MKEHKLSTGKAVGTILAAVVIMVIAQGISMSTGILLIKLGVPQIIGSLIVGILYPICAFIEVKLWIEKFLKEEMKEYRITSFKVKPIWCLVAVLLPSIVSLLLIATPGHFQVSGNNPYELWSTVVLGVFYVGIGSGIVEEMIFRGLIMGAAEKRWNKYIAVVIPSLIFALLHVVGNSLSFGSFIQLLIAGITVGVLFSLIAFESESFWSGAIVHCIWNIVMLGGILHIASSAKEAFMYSYVLESKSFLITGGDFGVEVSIMSIFTYLVCILLALRLLNKKD